MKTLKFKKEESGNWYIVLPEWKGTKAELKMVSGADTLLDTLSDGKKKVEVLVSLRLGLRKVEVFALSLKFSSFYSFNKILTTQKLYLISRLVLLILFGNNCTVGVHCKEK